MKTHPTSILNSNPSHACHPPSASPEKGRRGSNRSSPPRPKSSRKDAFRTGRAVGKPWNVAKGDWQIHDGTLVGKEKKEDNHAAVLRAHGPESRLDHPPFLQVRRRHHSERQLQPSEGAPVPCEHHACWGRDHHRRGQETIRAPRPCRSAKPRRNSRGGQWYTIQVEIKGQKVAVQTEQRRQDRRQQSRARCGTRPVSVLSPAGSRSFLADVKAWEVAP